MDKTSHNEVSSVRGESENAAGMESGRREFLRTAILGTAAVGALPLVSPAHGQGARIQSGNRQLLAQAPKSGTGASPANLASSAPAAGLIIR
ncbi:MAG: hypothetical protein JWN98_1315, partial [Abditibacteriota bacterium]|nr:hypothetical protein [Abditibacteriota bacterium]